MGKRIKCGKYGIPTNVQQLEIIRSVVRQIVGRYCIGFAKNYYDIKEKLSIQFNEIYDKLEYTDFNEVNRIVSSLYDSETDYLVILSKKKKLELMNGFLYSIRDRLSDIRFNNADIFVEKLHSDIDILLNSILDCYITSLTIFINNFIDELVERSEHITGKFSSPFYEMVLTHKPIEFDLDKYVCDSNEEIIVYDIGGIKITIPNKKDSIRILEKCADSSDILALLVSVDFSI